MTLIPPHNHHHARPDTPPAAAASRPFITCKELYGFLDDYLDGCLTPPQLEEFERHLRVCPSCVNYLDGYRRTVELGKTALSPDQSAAPASAPPGLIDAVRAALERQRRDQHSAGQT